MINKVKRKIVLGAVLLSASMALAACDINGFSNSAPNTNPIDNSVSYTSSAIDDTGNFASGNSSNTVVLTSLNAVSNKDDYEIGDELDITVTATYSNGDVVVVEGYEVE